MSWETIQMWPDRETVCKSSGSEACQSQQHGEHGLRVQEANA